MRKSQGLRKRKMDLKTVDAGEDSLVDFHQTLENVKTILVKSDVEPRFYHEKFLYIRPKFGGAPRPFKYRAAQRMFYKRYMQIVRSRRPVRIIVLKSRKVGISTLVEAECFRRTCSYEGLSSKIISHDKTSAKKIFEMNNLFYQMLPEELQPMKKYHTKEEFMFENPDAGEYRTNPGLGSGISLMTAKNAEGGRGETNQYVHFSEFAFYGEFAEQVYRAMMNTMSDHAGTVSVIESTANGEGGPFYDMWIDAMENLRSGEEYGYYPVFIPWIVDPDCFIRVTPEQSGAIYETLTDAERDLIERFGCNYGQLAWRRFTIKTKVIGQSVELFDVEFPVTWRRAFSGSGKTAFNKEALKHFTLMVRQREANNPGKRGFLHGPSLNETGFVEDDRGNLTIWEMPRDGMNYFIGGDPCQGRAQGKGDDPDYDPDYAVLQVFDQTGKQCARWRGIVEPTPFAEEAVRLGFFYKVAMLNIEVNIAWGAVQFIKRVYPNLYHWERYEDEIPNRESTQVMFETTGKSVHFLRERLLFFVNQFFRDDYGVRLKIYDPVTLSEMKTMEWDQRTGGLEARSGCKDDCVIAMGLSFIAMSQLGFGYPQMHDEGSDVMIPGIQSDPEVIGSRVQYDPMYGNWLTA